MLRRNYKPITISLFFLIFVSIACNQKTIKENSQEVEIVANKKSIVKPSYLEAFNSFRQHIYQKNAQELLHNFDFPLRNYSLSSLVTRDYKERDKDFSINQKNFNSNLNKIFFDDFINSLLKVKSKKLFEKGEYETPKINVEVNGVQYGYAMIATFDSTEKNLSLVVGYEFYDENGEKQTESARGYTFKYDKNNQLKFVDCIDAD